MNLYKGYEMVVGLEVHCELRTKTKIFCTCPTTFGAEPNTQCCPVCMGLPGTLPVLNRQVVDYAVKAGLATNCTIARYSKQDRKNYFYPDLPKAYQISQYDLPLCEHGWLDIETDEGAKRIGITRIHIEEDAGKLIHDPEKGTMIDCNRCGVPLIEIVSEPDIRSAAEAVAYVRKLRSILLYTGVSDCRMQEGSLRCDVNLSVRKAGETAFGTRTEMKNINSFTFIQRAIEYEYKRQVDALENGEVITQETRRFDPNTGKTSCMRKKEDADDYRYFPDPDLPPIRLSEELISQLQAEIPVLPDERKRQYMERYGLTAYDGELLTASRELADYFESCAALTDYPKLLANLLIAEIFRILPPEFGAKDLRAAPARFAAVAQLMGDGTINSGTAKKLAIEVWNDDIDPAEAVKERGLAQINDAAVITGWVKQALEESPGLVQDYRAGKTKAASALIGRAMAKSQGKANPVLLNRIAMELLQ